MMALPESVEITGVYTGKIKPFGDDKAPSGIVKLLRTDKVRITKTGLAGDQQADKRVHGGVEKAVMQFCIDNYQDLRSHFPQKSQRFVAGALGENISAGNFNESNVHVGDVFQLGSAVVQVSQPRKPCWKIDQRIGITKLSMHVSKQAISGWYYRVLEEGDVQTGDSLTRIDMATSGISLKTLWGIYLDHRPALEVLEHAAHQHGLAPEWQHQLSTRVNWLRNNS